jgi:hypothetical protein
MILDDISCMWCTMKMQKTYSKVASICFHSTSHANLSFYMMDKIFDVHKTLSQGGNFNTCLNLIHHGAYLKNILC